MLTHVLLPTLFRLALSDRKRVRVSKWRASRLLITPLFEVHRRTAPSLRCFSCTGHFPSSPAAVIGKQNSVRRFLSFPSLFIYPSPHIPVSLFPNISNCRLIARCKIPPIRLCDDPIPILRDQNATRRVKK
ncbi:hypothetical protein B0J15DRAFT_195921 [Fusarium solani]|uniref:Uncharacterized protein n=1 Tax=Fusarium solani TaxID=169388 RepID=A0A9P9G4Y5_FUSSL|nr:uncharacterized protein B0J15DRAFT_195921 [Fusarium solani]KAH7232112.1 hypothetical protein B0J15DRAFT_195921 [Fusarium solani]